MLIEVHDTVGGGSFPEIGQKVYGKTGKVLTDISLFFSQFGFVCAYVYFIGSQMQQVIQCMTSDTPRTPTCDGGVIINKWWFLPICMIIYVPLVLVRKIEKFAGTHLFADIMIFLTLVAIVTYASVHVSNVGHFTTEGFFALNTQTWPDAIGFSVYAFEGIGVILPIMEVTVNKEEYFKILSMVVFAICLLYISFSEFTLFAYGG
jgi:proton-coupled amino acid transporter